MRPTRPDRIEDGDAPGRDASCRLPDSGEMATVLVARAAMHTRFEILLHGDDPVRLRAAGEQALDEIERLEDQLSLYRSTSEIARANRDAADRPVRVSPIVFRLLERAAVLSRETRGAFDPTIGPLVRCWGFMGGSGRRPDPVALEEARRQVGMDGVVLEAARFTVRFTRPGMMLDLGAIGKGFAIDHALEFLREAGVTSAFLHGGTSSCYALGHPPDAPVWKAALRDPRVESTTGPDSIGPAHGPSGLAETRNSLIEAVPLVDASLGVSGIWSKSFVDGGRVCGHVIDPRLGEPVHGACLAAVVLPSATETDALSTALLTLGEAGIAVLERLRPDARCLLVEPGGSEGEWRVRRRQW